MAIIWTKAMSVGNGIIDHDHQFMIGIVNTIELILQAPTDIKNLPPVFELLLDYSKKHFRNEESIQRKIEYPQSIKHRTAHSNLLTELVSLMKDIEKHSSSEDLTKESERIVLFLRNWLINHVLKEDLLLKPYLEKLPYSYS